MREKRIAGLIASPVRSADASSALVDRIARSLSMDDPRRTRRRRPLEYRGRGARVRHASSRKPSSAQGTEHRSGCRRGGPGRALRPGGGRALSFSAVSFDTDGLDDSKRLTRRAAGATQAERIRGGALAWALGIAEVEEIDLLNVLEATRLAMVRAIEALRRSARRPAPRRHGSCPMPRREAGVHREGRRAIGYHRGSVHRGEGCARRYDAGVGPLPARLRSGSEHGIRERVPPRRPPSDGALPYPQAIVPRDDAGVAVRVVRRAA